MGNFCLIFLKLWLAFAHKLSYNEITNHYRRYRYGFTYCSAIIFRSSRDERRPARHPEKGEGDAPRGGQKGHQKREGGKFKAKAVPKKQDQKARHAADEGGADGNEETASAQLAIDVIGGKVQAEHKNGNADQKIIHTIPFEVAFCFVPSL